MRLYHHFYEERSISIGIYCKTADNETIQRLKSIKSTYLMENNSESFKCMHGNLSYICEGQIKVTVKVQH